MPAPSPIPRADLLDVDDPPVDRSDRHARARAAAAETSAPQGAGDDAPDAARDDAPDDARGGAWLTYRYRLGGEDTPEATGTMKAPSFGSAARRILARGLGATIGLAPAYLRLRAAGEQEVLLRVERTSAGAGAVPRFVVVPNGTYQFTPAPDPLSSAGGEPAPA